MSYQTYKGYETSRDVMQKMMLLEQVKNQQNQLISG